LLRLKGPRNRHVYHFARLASAVRPLAVVMENVPRVGESVLAVAKSCLAESLAWRAPEQNIDRTARKSEKLPRPQFGNISTHIGRLRKIQKVGFACMAVCVDQQSQLCSPPLFERLNRPSGPGIKFNYSKLSHEPAFHLFNFGTIALQICDSKTIRSFGIALQTTACETLGIRSSPRYSQYLRYQNCQHYPVNKFGLLAPYCAGSNAIWRKRREFHFRALNVLKLSRDLWRRKSGPF
jgi:hypothetical protein